MVTQYLTCPVMCFSMHDRQRWFDLVTTEVFIRSLCPFPKFTHYILPKKRHRLFQKRFGKNIVCIAIQFSLSHVDSKLSKRMSAAAMSNPVSSSLAFLKCLFRAAFHTVSPHLLPCISYIHIYREREQCG